LSKFSAVGTEQAMDSDGASPDKMCNSMKGSLIKKQVKFKFIIIFKPVQMIKRLSYNSKIKLN
jgi:hypothetical protein